MNSRERLRTVLNGRVPDRVPVSTYELVGYNSKAWENSEPSYARLMDFIRRKTDCICMWNPGSNERFLASSAPVETEKVVSREGETTTTRTTVGTGKGILSRTEVVKEGVHTKWRKERWCKSKEDVDKALSVPYEPLEYDFSDLPRITEEVGDRGIIMSSLSDAFGLAAALMEMGDYTVWALTETEHFGRTVARLHERNMENLQRMLEQETVDLYRICGPEYATPPYLPPEYFRRFVQPCVREMVELIHSHGALARVHSHGRIGEVLGMIEATGTDGLDPCEGPPDGDISLREVKERVGDSICLFGNLQLKLLEGGTRDEVEAAVKECMEAAKAGGGYVIMPTAAPINVPLAEQTEKNYICFIEAALRYGWY